MTNVVNSSITQRDKTTHETSSKRKERSPIIREKKKLRDKNDEKTEDVEMDVKESEEHDDNELQLDRNKDDMAPNNKGTS